MANNRKSKTLIGDVYDLIAGNRNFVTPKMFTDKHPELEVDYDRLEIHIETDTP